MKIADVLNLKHIGVYNQEKIIQDLSLNFPLLLEFESNGILNAGVDFFRLTSFCDPNETILSNCVKCKRATPFSKHMVIYNPYGFVKLQNNLFKQFLEDSGPNTKKSLKQLFCEKFQTITLEFNCTLKPEHKMYIVFAVEDLNFTDYEDGVDIFNRYITNKSNEEEVVIAKKFLNTVIVRKIGQYPDIADLSFIDMQKYSKILGKRYMELKRAISLYYKNYSVGSFAYLRRILEYVVDMKYKTVKDTEGFNDAFYSRAKFGDRIRYLEEFEIFIFPEPMQAIKEKLYALLSKGIHELDDEECKEYFEHILFAIEIILDRLLYEKETNKKLENIVKKIVVAPK